MNNPLVRELIHIENLVREALQNLVIVPRGDDEDFRNIDGAIVRLRQANTKFRRVIPDAIAMTPADPGDHEDI